MKKTTNFTSTWVPTLEETVSELQAVQQKTTNDIMTLRRDYSATGDDLARNLTKLLEDRQLATKPVALKMTGFHAKKLNGTRFVSPCFYTTSESHGYKVHITVDANGLGEGINSYMAMHFWLYEGENDNILDWPFTGVVTFILLNQLENKNHCTKSFSINAEQNLLVGKGFGYNSFIPHSELGYSAEKNTQYLKDDTLFFRVLIKAANQKPWLEYNCLFNWH